MELGICTDSLRDLAFEPALDAAVSFGVTAVEVAAGGMSSAPHLDLDRMLADVDARRRWTAELDRRGLRLAALNCSAWLLHPVRGEASRTVVERAMQLAGVLGVRKIVTMSGLPGDGPAGSMPNWLWSTWPTDAVELRERQWEMAIELWHGLVSRARLEGVEQIALELHPFQLVYNVPTLRRLRATTGPEIGANLDPSHLFWQGMDPVAVVSDLGEAIYHVHMKDTEIRPQQVALNGVLDHSADPEDRAWNFRAVGLGHGVETWRALIDALDRVGYDDVLSVENDDPFLPAADAIRSATEFIKPLLGRGEDVTRA